MLAAFVLLYTFMILLNKILTKKTFHYDDAPT